MKYLRHISRIVLYVAAAIAVQMGIYLAHSHNWQPDYMLWQSTEYMTHRSADNKIAWSQKRNLLGATYCISGPALWADGFIYFGDGAYRSMEAYGTDDTEYAIKQVDTPPIDIRRLDKLKQGIWDAIEEDVDADTTSDVLIRESGFPFPFLRCAWLVDDEPDWNTKTLPDSWMLWIGTSTSKQPSTTKQNFIIPEIKWIHAIGSIAATSLAITTIFWTLRKLKRLILRRMRMRKEKCISCGYKLDHAMTQCPECGTATQIRNTRSLLESVQSAFMPKSCAYLGLTIAGSIACSVLIQIIAFAIHSQQSRPSYYLWQVAKDHMYRAPDDEMVWSIERGWAGSWYCISHSTHIEYQSPIQIRPDKFRFNYYNQYHDQPVRTSPLTTSQWQSIWDAEYALSDRSGHNVMVMRSSGFPFPFLRCAWLVDQEPEWTSPGIPDTWKVAIGRSADGSNTNVSPEIEWRPAIASIGTISIVMCAIVCAIGAAFRKARKRLNTFTSKQ